MVGESSCTVNARPPGRSRHAVHPIGPGRSLRKPRTSGAATGHSPDPEAERRFLRGLAEEGGEETPDARAEEDGAESAT